MKDSMTETITRVDVAHDQLLTAAVIGLSGVDRVDACLALDALKRILDRHAAVCDPGMTGPRDVECTCDVEDDGGPESGPHLSIDVDSACPLHGVGTQWAKDNMPGKGDDDDDDDDDDDPWGAFDASNDPCDPGPTGRGSCGESEVW